MPAYVIAQVEIEDEEGYRRYRQLVPATIERYGGRFLARGGSTETLEGDWRPARLVVIEFPDMERARAWHGSPEYEPARALRWQTATSTLVLTEGVRA